MIKKGINNSHKKDIFFDLQDYMFTSKNINRYTKHIIHFNNENIIPKSSLKNIVTNKKETINNVKEIIKETEVKETIKKTEVKETKKTKEKFR